MARVSKKVNPEQQYARLTEEAKLTNDYLKHIATLDTGSLIIIATFSEKFAGQEPNTILYIRLVVFFLTISLFSVATSQGLLTIGISRFTDAKHIDDIDIVYPASRRWLYRITSFIAHTSLMISLAFLLLYILSVV